jgi:hypothetical protein
MGRSNCALSGAHVCQTSVMACGGQPTSVLSVVAFVCAAGVVLGHGPMLAIVGMFCAVLAMARGEGLAGPAVLVALVVLVLSFVLPTSIALNRMSGGGLRTLEETATSFSAGDLATTWAPNSLK